MNEKSEEDERIYEVRGVNEATNIRRRRESERKRKTNAMKRGRDEGVGRGRRARTVPDATQSVANRNCASSWNRA